MPEPFLLGASIAGHQVDGGAHDQWTAWEEENDIRLAKKAIGHFGRLPNWDRIKKAATSPDNYRSGGGVEHKKHYKADLKMLKDMGLNSLRFSIEWAELEPRQGEWSSAAFLFYDDYFAELERLKIEPLVTLWHWTHPQWFEIIGGFDSPDYLKYFSRYVRKVTERWGNRINWLIILNEPNVYTSLSYIRGQRPPARHSPGQARRVYRHLARAHRHAYRIIKDIRPEMMIGTSVLLNNVQPKRPRHPIDSFLSHWERLWWNWWFLEQVRWQLDFIGVNYYFTDYIKNLHKENPDAPLSDMGWYMEPSGLEHVLYRARLHFKRPLIVTETGVADADDQWRGWWIEKTLEAVKRARDRNIDVRGYFHWSLLDNFEWDQGWWPQFGLINVDRSQPGMPRKARPSTKAFKTFKP